LIKAWLNGSKLRSRNSAKLHTQRDQTPIELLFFISSLVIKLDLALADGIDYCAFSSIEP
jgi:hypothetical protein